MTTTFSRPIEDMTHEELAREAIRAGKADGNADLENAGRKLLEAVEAEHPSDALADLVETIYLGA